MVDGCRFCKSRRDGQIYLQTRLRQFTSCRTSNLKTPSLMFTTQTNSAQQSERKLESKWKLSWIHRMKAGKK